MKFPDVFTPDQARVVAELSRRDFEERRSGIREDISLKAVAPEVAELLYNLIVQKSAKKIVEFGTSHGYSTLYLAAAAEKTDGHVHTVDVMPEKTALASSHLAAANLLRRVTLTTSDGADFISSLPDGIDFVLVDVPLTNFMPAFEALRGRIATGGLIFVDGGPDGYFETGNAKEFKTMLAEAPDFLVSVLPVRKQQLLWVKL